MIQITEKDDRLLLQFWDDSPNVEPNGMMSINLNPTLMKEIDITTHIERAVENVLSKRT